MKDVENTNESRNKKTFIGEMARDRMLLMHGNMSKARVPGYFEAEGERGQEAIVKPTKHEQEKERRVELPAALRNKWANFGMQIASKSTRESSFN
ncbi:hypothetical protein HZH66_004362 [Vespula vulgaris]|uniref:Uncharacterized protein n=1 Tax=Vespula vulgaris TaxID=7454 RepID=A0A834KET3_VESVU|nr:hypothetical protein HZH66_004362 [Vespula vulgaris]